MDLLQIFADCAAEMDELGYIHSPLNGSHGSALFPIRHEPASYGRGSAVVSGASVHKGPEPAKKYSGVLRLDVAGSLEEELPKRDGQKRPGILMLPNPGMPPERFLIWLASSSSTRREASLTAARTRSCNIS